MHIETLSDDNLLELANFLEATQAQHSTHIGYLGSHRADIATSLGQVARDMFLVAKNQQRIQGFLGADIDGNRAWIYGPSGTVETVNALWQQLEPQLVAFDWIVFADVENQLVKQFATQIGCQIHDSPEHVLVCTKKPSAPKNQNISPFIPTYNAAFCQLHNLIFPNTYYSGQEILERLSEKKRLFVDISNGSLSGYSYAEISSEQEASLEFIGVAPDVRGRGIGQDLMAQTLDWIFSSGVKNVSLTVNSSNHSALKMYQKLGFSLERVMVSYRKNLSRA